MTHMCPSFARQWQRAMAEAEPHRLPKYVRDRMESSGNEPAPDMLPSIPVEDPSRPFASDDGELSAARLVGK